MITPTTGHTMTPPTDQERDDAVTDITSTITAEIASDWSLWPDDPDTTAEICTRVTQYTNKQPENQPTPPQHPSNTPGADTHFGLYPRIPSQTSFD